jgi:HEAT repeat protein
MLRVLEAEFPAEPASETNVTDDTPGASHAKTNTATPAPAAARDRAFDRAWRDLRALHLERPDDVKQLLAAAASGDVASRQAAARVLLDADPPVALTAWDALVADPSRTVRRATVDAMVDAARPAVRPMLERALDDRDAWTRWKALRGLVDLGIEPSRAAAAPLVTDTDFRVRLEAVRALRDPSDGSLRG